MPNKDLKQLDAALGDCTADAIVDAFTTKLGGVDGCATELEQIYKHDSTDQKTKLKILDMVIKTRVKLDAQKMQAGVPPQVLVLINAVIPELKPESPMLATLERLALSLGGNE